MIVRLYIGKVYIYLDVIRGIYFDVIFTMDKFFLNYWEVV